MNTCENCQWWVRITEVALVNSEFWPAGKIPGFCHNVDAFPQGFEECSKTWLDFPACPRFKAKQHWSEEAAERVFDISLANSGAVAFFGANPKDAKDKYAKIIRECAEKAGVK